MSQFSEKSLLNIFKLVVNYARNLYLAFKLYPSSSAADPELQIELDYTVSQLKLFLLLYDSNLSISDLAKCLCCEHETLKPDDIRYALSTTNKVMSVRLRSKIHFLSLRHEIIDFDKEKFHTRCVSVLSRMTKLNYRSVFSYKTTDGGQSPRSEYQKLLDTKKKITLGNMVSAG